MAIIKNTFRLGLITALAGGAVVVVAGPQRCMAVLMQAQQHVNHVIDANIDDPIALRSQLRNLEAKYPARITEVEQDLFKIQAERSNIEREFAVDQKAIEITQGKLGQLKDVLVQGEALESNGNFVRINFERDRMDMDEGYRLASHYDTLLTNFQASAHENDLYLDMLIDQENQLAELLGHLEAEQQEFQSQLAQLDRQVDAIARNERLITMLEERQASFNKYDNPYTAPNSDAVRTKIASMLSDQERRIAALQDKGQMEDIRVRAERELQINREVRKSFQSNGFQHRPTIELEPKVIEIGPDQEESFATESEIASRGG
jgi:peptidoglycan hydrolase CwlO-like protein